MINNFCVIPRIVPQISALLEQRYDEMTRVSFFVNKVYKY